MCHSEQRRENSKNAPTSNSLHFNLETPQTSILIKSNQIPEIFPLKQSLSWSPLNIENRREKKKKKGRKVKARRKIVSASGRTKRDRLLIESQAASLSRAARRCIEAREARAKIRVNGGGCYKSVSRIYLRVVDVPDVMAGNDTSSKVEPNCLSRGLLTEAHPEGQGEKLRRAFFRWYRCFSKIPFPCFAVPGTNPGRGFCISETTRETSARPCLLLRRLSSPFHSGASFLLSSPMLVIPLASYTSPTRQHSHRFSIIIDENNIPGWSLTHLRC